MRPTALLGAALLLVTACGDRVTHVERVVLVNGTDYDVVVQVKAEGRNGWLPLGLARHGAETLFEEVIDQGDTWVFHFSYGGREAGEVLVGRAELARAGWKVEVPQEAAERLRAQGLVPPP